MINVTIYCRILEYKLISAGSNAEAVQSIIDYDLLALLLQLLTNPDTTHTIHLPALKAVGGMLHSTVAHKQYLLDMNILFVIKRFLGNVYFYICVVCI